ncbi:voltage-dependent calcium channel subunit alpha-2/delta-3-like [Babylonia areolata]|uniref:voltage-dependent calcium channel subunit alpha-2/delta-3-like n=1 Tax=Babylonia areolata TaxID=304850 RepID=UPI003FD2AE65
MVTSTSAGTRSVALGMAVGMVLAVVLMMVAEVAGQEGPQRRREGHHPHPSQGQQRPQGQYPEGQYPPAQRQYYPQGHRPAGTEEDLGGRGGGGAGGGGRGVDTNLQGGVGGDGGGGGGGDDDDSRELDINLLAANATAYKLRSKLVGLAKSLTGAGVLAQIYSKKNSPISVTTRPSQQIANLITDVSLKMQNMLKEKEKAVMALKKAAEKSMKEYGAYKEQIDYEEVEYFNAKKVVIDSSLQGEHLPKIKGTIDYLHADKVWEFGSRNLNLTTNVSTVHVPTNIYDKSMKILNGVEWTENLTQQFINNSDRHPNLRWQYFCSSDGFFRIFPGTQWPRDPEKVDVFDCRMQKWYIQAASTPKNIIILLDTSGSMTGKRFTIAQSTVFTILETLSDEDYFNIIKFSKEPEYVDPCFNGTMMPANVDNIRRMKEKIMDISTRDMADFRKALTLAFRLFKEEQKTGGGSICNKAIMIITDGAPENYVDIYNKSNWPQKATRIFTYLIGKEVSDDRKVQWMACVNKGEFTHISTKADVQENVQQYIKVLSRPLVQNKSSHDVWSAIYLDYPTAQSPVISSMPHMTNNLDAAFEDSATFKGMGLVMSFAMPVFDPRTNKTVSKHEERPEKNLLGVVGTDIRINDIVKLIPRYQLGVNGYAFAVTNHGYILFHPDFRPFYKPDGQPNDNPELQLRPKYNSVDLSEVELPYDQGVSREHPLRKYLLTAREGGQNTTQTVLTHFDDLKRVKLQKNRYQFVAVGDTFRLVFVLPDNYGDKTLSVDPFAVPDLKTAFDDVGAKSASSGSSHAIAPWIHCTDEQGRQVKMDGNVLYQFVQWKPKVKYECDKSLVRHLLLDAKETLTYGGVWNGSSFNPGEGDGPVKEECISRSPDNAEAPCIRAMYPKYGIDFVWIGTASGFTRYKYFYNLELQGLQEIQGMPQPDLPQQYTATIQSLYYQRAVYGWDEGLDYIYYMERDVVTDRLYVVMTTAEVVGRRGNTPAPLAVSALRMRHDSFEDIFVTETADCPGRHKCKVTCRNKDVLNCYLIDNNGYIMASNNNKTTFEKGEFFGTKDPTLMKELIRHQFFIQLNVTDYQAMCKSQVSSQESSATFITTPFRLLFQVFFWFLAEVGLFLTEWSIRSWFFLWSVGSQNPESECGSTEYPQNVRYFLCNYVVFEHSNQAFNEHVTVNNHACVQTASRFTLNTTTVKAKKRFNGSLTDCGHCSASHTLSYTVIWLERTNLILIMAAADCQCNTVNTTFESAWKEVEFSEEQQCERLYKFSTELKRVDNTRTANALCLDSRDEEDYTCGHPGMPSPCLHLLLLLSLLTYTCCCQRWAP